MPRKMEASFGPKAEPWKEGRVVAGFFEKVEEIPGCESRKITMMETGKAGSEVSIWETAALSRFVKQFEVGGYYKIKCLGKTTYGSGNSGWAFDVESFEPSEIDAAIRAHANKDTVPF